MYAEANRWSEVARTRAIMKDRGVQKIWPGSSWIEVKKKMHQFAACDNYHPASEEIYSVLDVLDLQLKLFGYEPHLDFVLEARGKQKACPHNHLHSSMRLSTRAAYG
ncbi:UNVERIFIED_CONTAM: Pentatricopeptide repeat-containing protein [Sesamum radiatum]|uniref:Pentatricopeptide repeat-containing protein n=1 Tax=Sesamum radiatum TaxID=300843 RepID=A0AAW2W7D7_SESRA